MKKENINNYGGYRYKYSVASYEDNVCRYDMSWICVANDIYRPYNHFSWLLLLTTVINSQPFSPLSLLK